MVIGSSLTSAAAKSVRSPIRWLPALPPCVFPVSTVAAHRPLRLTLNRAPIPSPTVIDRYRTAVARLFVGLDLLDL